MAIQGLRDTSNFVADQRPKNYREGIMLLFPNGTAPLTALTSMMKTRRVDDPEFYWWEKEMDNRRVALAANIATTNQLVFTIASKGLSIVEGDILMVEQTGELVYVTQDPGIDTTIAVSRGWAGSTPATVTYNAAGVNPNLIIVGNAFEEGSLAPTGVNFDPTKAYNYTQIFRKTLEMTRTAAKTRLRTGDAVKEAKRECLEILSNDIERALWMGKKVSTSRNGKPLHTMDGVDQFIAVQNKFTANGAGATMEDLEGWMKAFFDYGSSQKMGFCGNRALLTINQIIRKNTTWQIQSGIKEAGMDVSRVISPFGELVLKTHPLWNQMSGGSTAGTAYAGRESQLTVLDMAQLTYVTFQDDDIKYQADLQANGMDGLQAGYLAELSLEVHFPKAHGQVTNLIKAAKDA